MSAAYSLLCALMYVLMTLEESPLLIYVRLRGNEV